MTSWILKNQIDTTDQPTTELKTMKISSKFPLLLIASIIGIANPTLHAGASNKSGNPFGNGTFFSTSGTFSGVLRGINIVGITTFSTGTNATFTGGPLYIYDASQGLYDDTQGVYASLNPAANTLNAMIFPATNTPAAGTTNTSVGGGSFTASLQTQPPNQTFNGSGVISEITDTTTLPISTTNIPFTISGVRISN